MTFKKFNFKFYRQDTRHIESVKFNKGEIMINQVALLQGKQLVYNGYAFMPVADKLYNVYSDFIVRMEIPIYYSFIIWLKSLFPQIRKINLAALINREYFVKVPETPTFKSVGQGKFIGTFRFDKAVGNEVIKELIMSNMVSKVFTRDTLKSPYKDYALSFTNHYWYQYTFTKI